MQYKTLAVIIATTVGLAVACSNGAKSPAAPDLANGGAATAVAADNPTLKASVPAPKSPSGQQESRVVTLVADPATGDHVSVAFTYRFEVEEDGAPFDGGVANGATYAVRQLGVNKTYRWRVRAEYDGRYTAWSPYMTFASPKELEGYLNAQGIFDPLTNGRTVGEIYGPVEFIPKVGVKLLDHTSRITYRLPEPLTAGEFSLMVTGIDEGTAGSKNKVMSMQQGDSDITENDYRFTAECRGRNFLEPGTVRFRIITGNAVSEDEIFDSPRIVVDFSNESWYFWRAVWRTGLAALDVREGNRFGPVLYEWTLGTGTTPYRPDPHVVHLGAPVGRGGLLDATAPGMIIKNVWVSSQPRPADLDK